MVRHWSTNDLTFDFADRCMTWNSKERCNYECRTRFKALGANSGGNATIVQEGHIGIVNPCVLAERDGSYACVDACEDAPPTNEPTPEPTGEPTPTPTLEPTLKPTFLSNSYLIKTVFSNFYFSNFFLAFRKSFSEQFKNIRCDISGKLKKTIENIIYLKF